jgi:hypothetical protein
VRPSSILCTRSSTPATILIAARHAAPATCTPRDKQTQFSKRKKIKEKQNETIQDSNSNLAMSMTHHNQTKELLTWFLINNHISIIRVIPQLNTHTDLNNQHPKQQNNYL